MAAFWAAFIFGGSGPAITAHGSLGLKQEIQIQIQILSFLKAYRFHCCSVCKYAALKPHLLDYANTSSCSLCISNTPPLLYLDH
jgi:hypothetical protein